MMKKRNRRVKRLVPVTDVKYLDPIVTFGDVTVKYSEIISIKDAGHYNIDVPQVSLHAKGNVVLRVVGITALTAYQSIHKQLQRYKKIGLI